MGICSAGAIAALSERFGAEEKFHVELSTFRKSRAVSAGGKRSRLRKAYVAASSTAFPKLDPRACQSVTTAACAPDSAVRDAFTDRREPVLPKMSPYPKGQPANGNRDISVAEWLRLFAFVSFGSRITSFLRLCGATHKHLM